jgi:hypothetical protein
MLVALLQTLLLLGAGVLLFRLWRAATPAERWLKLVVVAGFLGRAILGQALFWISWARLPFARSLQTGNGLWFFATDAGLYFREAWNAAEMGPWGILTFDRTMPSVTYIQALGTTVLLVGRATSSSLLLNLFCYLGTIAVLLHWGRQEPRARTAVALAIVAISLSPAFVLWSLQPLKDTFFQFLVVAFVATCAAWQRARVAGRGVKTYIAVALLLLVLLFAIAGIRWYFAFALWIASSIFFLLVVFRTGGRRIAATAIAIVMALLLSRSIVLAARPYIPEPVLKTLEPSTAVAAIAKAPSSIFKIADTTRTGFERTGGNTVIKTGRRLEPPPAPAPSPAVAKTPAPAKTPKPAPTPAPVDPAAAEVRAMLEKQMRDWNSGNFDDVEELWRGLGLPADVKERGQLILSDLKINVTNGKDGTVAGRWRWARPSPAMLRNEGAFKLTLRRSAEGWKVVQTEATPAPVPPPAPAPAPPARPAAEGAADAGDQIQRSSSRAARLVSGAAAVVLPRVVGEALGLFHVGGGRGMFWFTELDTLVFDAVLLCAIFVLARRFAPALRNPMAWLVVLFTLLVGVPLVYTVTNFGTLIRLREMIYLGILLAPLAAATTAGRETSETEEVV